MKTGLLALGWIWGIAICVDVFGTPPDLYFWPTALTLIAALFWTVWRVK